MPGEFSVLVVVVTMLGVAVPVMDVIDVVPVLNGLMAAAFSMGVLGHRVLGDVLMVVVVVAVPGVAVPVMDVIDVVPVLNGLMAAAFSMGVLGHGVVSVGVGSAHSFPFFMRFPARGRPHRAPRVRHGSRRSDR